MSANDIVNKWFEKAKNDLIVAEHIFNKLTPKQIEIVCYHCQQSAEKALKGFLLYCQIEHPRTHNLVMLCQMCMEKYADFNDIMEQCIDLTSYSVTTRYPNEIDITEDEGETAIVNATKIYDFIKSKIS